jgi:hypothetical protein
MSVKPGLHGLEGAWAGGAVRHALQRDGRQVGLDGDFPPPAAELAPAGVQGRA